MKKSKSSALLTMCLMVVCIGGCSSQKELAVTPQNQTTAGGQTSTVTTTTTSAPTTATTATAPTSSSSSPGYDDLAGGKTADATSSPGQATSTSGAAPVAVTPTPTTATTSTSPPTTSSATSTSTTTSTAPTGTSAAPLATADGETTGIRAEVTELKRTSDSLMKLKFTVIDDTDNELAIRSTYLGTGSEWASVAGVTLIDEAGKKKYFVVHDTAGTSVCSHDISNVAAHSRENFWVQFPAPPANVQKITISIPHFEPMNNVPISQ